MVEINSVMSTITLNVIGLNTSIKRETLKVYQKARPNYILSTETHFKYGDTDWKKDWRMIHHANTNQNKARVAILISDKTDFRWRKIFKDKRSIT